LAAVTTRRASSAERTWGAITPERTAVQRRGDVLGIRRRHAHERRDARRQRRHADLAGGIPREPVVLDIDIERIEARAGRHARYLDVAHETHGHGRNDLVAREFFLHAVPQNVANLGWHVLSVVESREEELYRSTRGSGVDRWISRAYY
jgi:hypothetical protein